MGSVVERDGYAVVKRDDMLWLICRVIDDKFK